MRAASLAVVFSASVPLVLHDGRSALPHLPTCRRPRLAAAPQCSKKSRRLRKKAAAAEGKALRKRPAAKGQTPRESTAMECEGDFCWLPDGRSVPRNCKSEASPPLQLLPSGNVQLQTPAAYEELRAQMSAQGAEVTIVRYGAPWCRSCSTIGPQLQALAVERWPEATFYELSLVRNGKAAGERMFRHYKARGVVSMPFFEVFVGAELVDTLDARTLELRSGDRL